ncbi:hypothetical protein ACFE04_007108 [Oxalis oulophora]
MSFLDKLRLLLHFLPVVKVNSPHTRISLRQKVYGISLRQKVIYTTVSSLLIFLVCNHIPMYGINYSTTGAALPSCRSTHDILLSNRGTLIELDILPIVTSKFLIQIGVGAKFTEVENNVALFLANMAANPLHAIFYVVLMLSGSALLLMAWIDVTKPSINDDVLHQLEEQSIILPLHRKITLPKIVDRYMPSVAAIIGLCIGALTLLADFNYGRNWFGIGDYLSRHNHV